ncbi:hypothetical protein HMPREF1572_00696, partial [Gardnerella vaginalis JCP7275]
NSPEKGVHISQIRKQTRVSVLAFVYHLTQKGNKRGEEETNSLRGYIQTQAS